MSNWRITVEVTWEAILAVAGAITVIGGSWLTIRKIQKDADASKKEHTQEILKMAKEEIALKEKDLQARLNALDTRIDSIESNIEKDLTHLKETYSGELKNLATKIEDLRLDLRNQHTQMVSLLTKMVENKE
jgi:glycerol-3-phosphate dehydrogenase